MWMKDGHILFDPIYLEITQWVKFCKLFSKLVQKVFVFIQLPCETFHIFSYSAPSIFSFFSWLIKVITFFFEQWLSQCHLYNDFKFKERFQSSIFMICMENASKLFFIYFVSVKQLIWNISGWKINGSISYLSEQTLKLS